MIKALQTGFGAALGAPLLTALRDRGVQMVRLDLQPVALPSQCWALVEEVWDARLRPLCIIRPEQAGWFTHPARLDIEVLNEPDLKGWTPQAYADAVRRVVDVSGGQHMVWAGSVSNCTKKKLDWLDNVVCKLPLGVGVTLHRYPKNGGRPEDPQEGFSTRWAELSRIEDIVGDRPWGVSEVGYHTGPQTKGWWLWRRRWNWTDLQVASFTAWELAWWKNAGAEFIVVYQLNDGVTGDPIDAFGIRRVDGTWKPVADVFQQET